MLKQEQGSAIVLFGVVLVALIALLLILALVVGHIPLA
jgi:hypothetical protein